MQGAPSSFTVLYLEGICSWLPGIHRSRKGHRRIPCWRPTYTCFFLRMRDSAGSERRCRSCAWRECRSVSPQSRCFVHSAPTRREWRPFRNKRSRTKCWSRRSQNEAPDRLQTQKHQSITGMIVTFSAGLSSIPSVRPLIRPPYVYLSVVHPSLGEKMADWRMSELTEEHCQYMSHIICDTLHVSHTSHI